MSPSVPASGRRCDHGKGSHTINLAVKCNHALHQSGGSRYHLKGRARSHRWLGCKIILWHWLIGNQLGVVFCINGISHLIIVISRIRNQRKHFPAINISDYHGGVTWIECQLCRCYINCFNSVHHELICTQSSVKQCCLILHRNVDNALFTKNPAYLISIDHIR